MKVFVLFLAWPLIEIALFVVVGGWLGLWLTLAIVLGTGILGVSLLRRQGMASMGDVRRSVGGIGELGEMAQRMIGVIAAILLILPGFLTDAIGLLLLIPPVQTLIFLWVSKRVAAGGARFSTNAPGVRPSPDTIDGDYEVIDDETGQDKRPTHMPSGWTRH